MTGYILTYFAQAGFVVKAVMLLLLGVSIFSWTIILQRAWYFKQKHKQYKEFNRRFWESGNLKQLYLDVDSNMDARHGLSAIFYAGFKEFSRLKQQGKVMLEPIQRVMQIRSSKESAQLDQYLPFLASVGSISPYVGLFGTVWGIMTSLQAIGQTQQATLAMVAPGIAEALVATALGLFAAIPAVMAYNRYTTQANQLISHYDLFQEELISLIEQQDQ